MSGTKKSLASSPAPSTPLPPSLFGPEQATVKGSPMIPVSSFSNEAYLAVSCEKLWKLPQLLILIKSSP